MPWPTTRRVIGTKVQRLDGPDKATGRAKYSFDINRPGLLHARILRSPHAHARIRTLDAGPAEKVPGFRAVHLLVKPGAELVWVGEEIAAICADTEEHAEDCLRAIRVEYEILPHAVKEADALRLTDGQGTLGGKTDAGVLNPANATTGGDFQTDKFDDVAFQNVAARHEGRYGVPVISHQCLESHGLVAEWDEKQENLTVWASTQAVPLTATVLAQHFKLPATRVKCI